MQPLSGPGGSSSDSLDALRRERDTLAVILDNSPEAQLAYLDADFRFVQVNSAYAEGAGYTKEQLLGKKHFELFPDAENEAIFRNVLESGEPIAFRGKPFVYEGQPWRGVTYWDWTLSPVKAEDGSVRGLVFSLVDVTERVRRQKLMEALARLDGLIHSTLDSDTIMHQLIKGAVEAAGCESGSIALRLPDGWSARYVHEVPYELSESRVLTAEEMPVAEMTAQSRDAVVVNDVSADERFAAALEPFGIKSLLDVPLFVGDEVVGVLALVHYAEAAEFTGPVIQFAERLAASASLALTNARLYEDEHRVAQAMRDALARPVAVVPDLKVGIVYRPAYEAERVGGDFYDVYELDGGLVAVLVGDVSGKGLTAAGLTETVRSSARTLAYQGLPAGEILTRLNATLRRQFEPGTFVTAVLGIIEPVSGVVTLASAGHPAPVMCGARSKFVPVPSGVVLGAFEAEYEEVAVHLDDETLLFYTDGVTEVQRNGMLFGHGRLLRALGSCQRRDPQATVDKLLEEISQFGRGILRDDVAMVAITRRHPEGDRDRDAPGGLLAQERRGE